MDKQLLIAQARSQIDRDFPVKPKYIETPLHKDCVLLVSTAVKPMRMRQIVTILCGDVPGAPGWTDRVCALAEALNDLRNAGILNCTAVGWTKNKTQER